MGRGWPRQFLPKGIRAFASGSLLAGKGSSIGRAAAPRQIASVAKPARGGGASSRRRPPPPPGFRRIAPKRTP
eukprot:4839880-Alexandrium_andersonii.AAC.1